MGDGTRAWRGGSKAIVGVAMLMVACAPTGPPAITPGRPGLPTGPTALPQFSPAEFRLLLAELRGKPVVVNIWASWCGPCVKEAPELAAVADEMAGRVQFVGVDVLDTRTAAAAFVVAHRWHFPSVFDPAAAIRNDLGYVGQPVTVVYSPDGERASVLVGAVTANRLRTLLAPLVSP